MRHRAWLSLLLGCGGSTAGLDPTDAGAADDAAAADAIVEADAARPRCVDPDFGGEPGELEAPIAHVEALLVDRAGGVVFGGYDNGIVSQRLYLGRLHADGNADVTFGNDGTDDGVIDILPSDVVYGGAGGELALELDALGRILVSTSNFADGGFARVGRLRSDGSLDESYGDGGWFLEPETTVVTTGGIVALDDGGALVVGTAQYFAGTSHVIMRRLDADGAPIEGFGDGGVIVTDFDYPYAAAFGVTVDDEGAFIVTGSVSSWPVEIAVFVARFLGDGSPDVSFGVDGFQKHLGEYELVGHAMAPDGKIILGARKVVSNKPGVLRFEADGDLDLTFGPSGSGESLLDRPLHLVDAPRIGSDGRIRFAGWFNTGGARLAAARLDADELPDDAFGPGGVVAGKTGRALSSVIDECDTILVGGYDESDPTRGLIARFGP